MKKPQMIYFEKEDILHLAISEEEETNSIELSPNITAELNEKGELIGIEILHASTFVRVNENFCVNGMIRVRCSIRETSGQIG